MLTNLGTILAELLNSQGSSSLLPDYSLNILFANEYFRNGGKPYTIVQKPPTSLNLPDRDPTHFTSLLHTWSDHAKEAKVQDVDRLISILMSSASTILAPKGLPDTPTALLANAVCPDNHPPNHSIRILGMLNQEEAQARGYADTLSQELYAVWTTKIPDFTSAIKSAVAAQDSRIESGLVSATVVKSQGTPAAGQPGSSWSRAISIGKGSLSTSNIKPGTVKAQLGMGLLSLAMIGLQMYYAISHWSDFKPEDKTQMIMCFVQGAAQGLTLVGGAWKVFRANNVPIRLNPLAGLRVMQRPIRNMPRAANQVGIQMIERGAPGAVQRQGNAASRRGALAANRAANLRAQRQARMLQVRGPPRQPVRAAFGYSVGMALLNAFFFLISIGLFISIMWKLIVNWNDFDPLTRYLVAQAVFIGIGLIIELIAVLGSVGICLGAATVCAWVGPIFLLVVIALGVAILIWGKRPISPLEKWIKEEGAPVMQNLPPLPPPKLTWSRDPEAVSSGSQTSVVINGAAADSRTNIAGITVSFTAGSDDKCLFKTDATMDFVLGSAIGPQRCVVESKAPDLDHHILVTGQQQSADGKIFSITLKVVTQCKSNKSMSFAKGQFLKYTITGMIATAGKFTVPVVEQWNDDRGALTVLIVNCPTN